MPSALANIIVLGLVAGFALQGLTNGLFFAAFLTLEVVVPLLLSLAFFDTLGNLLAMTGLPEGWALFAGFGLVSLGGLIGLNQARIALAPEEGVRTFKLVDKLGGAAVGAFGGAAAAGLFLILWSVCPGTVRMPINTSELKVDLGANVIEKFAALNRSIGDKTFIVKSEAPAKQGQAGVVKSALPEPYLDRDGDGNYTEGEPIIDLDGDKKWSKTFYFKDTVIRNNKWDIGILERYKRAWWAKLYPD